MNEISEITETAGLAAMGGRIPAMSPEAVGRVRRLEEAARRLPQAETCDTMHTLHAGMYARTVRIPAGSLLVGVFIKIPTVLVVSGCAKVFNGEAAMLIRGHSVIAASAGRKQAFLALEDTHVTMAFPTRAASVQEAEDEFTDEADLLLSRKEGYDNFIEITGE